MKIIICGSRTFNDYDLFKKEMDEFLSLSNKESITLISGGAKGADSLTKKYAIENSYKFIEVPAEWNLHGKKAGFLRNIKMLENADSVIAFWDGISKGTAHTIKETKKRNLPLVIIDTL